MFPPISQCSFMFRPNISSARTYDAALPLLSLFVDKMKSLNDCFNMTIQVYQIPAESARTVHSTSILFR